MPIFVLLAAIFCALGNRLRGSAVWHEVTGTGATLARIIAWGVPCGVVTFFASFLSGFTPVHSAIVGLLVVPAIWIGATIPLFNAIDLGHNDGRFVIDLGLLIDRGVMGVLLASIVIGFGGAPHWYLLLCFGTLMGPLYWLAWVKPLNIPSLGCFRTDPPPTGELYYGAAIGIGLALSFCS